MIKKIAVVLLVLVLLSMSSVTASAYDDIIEQTRYSVVRFRVLNNNIYYVGTGFCIGIEGDPVSYIVTNYHVVADNNNMICDDIQVWTGTSSNGGPCYNAEVIDYSIEHDYAVVKTDTPIIERVPLKFSNHEVRLTDTVYSVGYPSGADTASSFSALPENATVIKGQISNLSKATSSPDCYQTTSVVSGGNSGGPALNENGEVVGIYKSVDSFVTDTNTVYSYVIKTDKLLPALDAKGIPYTVAESYGGNTPLIVIAVITAAAVSAGIIVIFFAVRRRREDIEIAEAVSKTSHTASSRTNLYSDNRIKFLISVQGNIYPIIADKNYIIGKDNEKCDLTPPADRTDGVSGSHCAVKITYDGNISISDLNSTYGTVVHTHDDKKQTIKPDNAFSVPLSHLDHVSLGSENVTVTIIRKDK